MGAGLSRGVRRVCEAAEGAHHALIDTHPASVWIALPDGSREFYKRSWQGLSAADSPGNEVAMFHPDDREYVVEKWRSPGATSQKFQVEARRRIATGEYPAILVRPAPSPHDKAPLVK